MPVRSSNSRVLKWPDAAAVNAAARRWARELAAREPAVLRVGYFGSYARGDWGVGSDLDLVVLLAESREPAHRRGVRWERASLPVPVDLLIYTREEWDRLAGSPFRETVEGEVVWCL